jgi:hypothetical protein
MVPGGHLENGGHIGLFHRGTPSRINRFSGSTIPKMMLVSAVSLLKPEATPLYNTGWGMHIFDMPQNPAM